MKRTFAIATLLLTTCLTIPAFASPDSRRETRSYLNSDHTVQSEGVLLADSREDEAWDRYRDERHRELDRQMNDEMNRPHNSRLSQQQKEKVIRDAHRELDKQLDRDEKEWKERYDRSNGRNDRSRDDRFDRRYDTNDRRNDRMRDSRYNNDRRYDDRRNDRSRSDNYYQVDPQNPYEQYRRRVGY